MKGFVDFATAAAKVGLVDETAYWIAGGSAYADGDEGWFVFDRDGTGTASANLIVVSAGGRLRRLTSGQETYFDASAAAINTALRVSALPVSGTVTANAGTGTQAVSIATLPALPTGANTIGNVGVVASVLPAGTDRSGSITTGGTAQTMAAANSARIGLTGQNISTGDLWINEIGGTAAASTAGSYKVPADGTFAVSTNRAVSVVGATTGQKFTATEY